MSIYALLDTQYGQKVASVLQQIEATLMPADAATLLHLKAGSPALRMLRCCFDQVTSWKQTTAQSSD